MKKETLAVGSPVNRVRVRVRIHFNSGTDDPSEYPVMSSNIKSESLSRAAHTDFTKILPSKRRERKNAAPAGTDISVFKETK